MAIDFMYSDIHIYIFPQSLFIHVTDFFSHLFYSVFFLIVPSVFFALHDVRAILKVFP